MPTPAPKAAKPTKEIFDPFNSSATGHQRAQNRLSGSTHWRDSRSFKLDNQFNNGYEGGKRLSDTVGAGMAPKDPSRKKANNLATWLNAGRQNCISDELKVEKDVERPAKRIKVANFEATTTNSIKPRTPTEKSRKSNPSTNNDPIDCSPSDFLSPIDPNTSIAFPSPSPIHDEESNGENTAEEDKDHPQIFANLVIYINGSTAPLVSDHKLKHILKEHGARLSIDVRRRLVTHVVLGRPTSASGAGGGLSGSKIQKEITMMRGEKVKFVTAEWVIESVKAGRRLPESRFEALKLAPKGVGNIAGFFGKEQRHPTERAGEDIGG